MFEPDSRCVASSVASPNHGERTARVDAIILHYTGMASAQAALDWLCNPLSQVSCHYFVREDGRIEQLVPEARRAWHAGKSFWRGENDMNSRSIGIEIVNPGHAGGLPPFPDRQIAATIDLCRDIMRRFAIPAPRVLAHSDIAPGRKQDPGERFPWHALHAAGIGHWVAPRQPAPGETLEFGAEGPDVATLQKRLARYGYGLDATGRYDAATQIVVTAFQRHFRPTLVDGVADASTIGTLDDLIAALPHSH